MDGNLGDGCKHQVSEEDRLSVEEVVLGVQLMKVVVVSQPYWGTVLRAVNDANQERYGNGQWCVVSLSVAKET